MATKDYYLALYGEDLLDELNTRSVESLANSLMVRFSLRDWREFARHRTLKRWSTLKRVTIESERDLFVRE